jgi:hypothetical protein
LTFGILAVLSAFCSMEAFSFCCACAKKIMRHVWSSFFRGSLRVVHDLTALFELLIWYLLSIFCWQGMNLQRSDSLSLAFDSVTRFSDFGCAAKTSCANVLYGCGW